MTVKSNLAVDPFADQPGEAAQNPGNSAWESLSSTDDPSLLCRSWIALFASQFETIAASVILLKNPRDGAFVPAAIWPNPFTDVAYLTPAAQQALVNRCVVEIQPSIPSESQQGQVLIAVPIEAGDELNGVVVLGIASSDSNEVQAIRRHLLWGGAWLSQFFFRKQQVGARDALARAGLVMDLGLVALEKMDFQESAMALVNEISIKLDLRRVSLGVLEKGDIRVRAVSHTAHFKRYSEAIQAIEKAMEEAFDQRREIIYPSPPESLTTGFTVTTDHQRLSKQRDGRSVASFLLSSHGHAFGVLTLESSTEAVFSGQIIAVGEALANVLGPVLAHQRELDQWVAGKARNKFDKVIEQLLGPNHPLTKLKAFALLCLTLLLVFAQGEFRVPAKTVVEGLVQRSVVAPFEGYISLATVRAGDRVSAQQVLATLDDKDLRLERIRWLTERDQTLGKYHEAQAKHDRSAASVLGAQLNQAEAQLGLIDEKLKRSVIKSPFDGIVVSGDLSQLLGAPVEQGKVLFEVTPLDAYRVILKVDERDIAYIRVGQPGQLVLSGLAADRLGFAVKKITSVSTAEEGINYFRVEAQLDQPGATIRPGMEGIGKVLVGEQRLAWIWTRRLSDWLTVKLWAWLP